LVDVEHDDDNDDNDDGEKISDDEDLSGKQRTILKATMRRIF
jgi:hypothetical protein